MIKTLLSCQADIVNEFGRRETTEIFDNSADSAVFDTTLLCLEVWLISHSLCCVCGLQEAVEKKEKRAQRFHFRAEESTAQRNVVLDKEMLKKGIRLLMLLFHAVMVFVYEGLW